LSLRAIQKIRDTFFADLRHPSFLVTRHFPFYRKHTFFDASKTGNFSLKMSRDTCWPPPLECRVFLYLDGPLEHLSWIRYHITSNEVGIHYLSSFTAAALLPGSSASTLRQSCRAVSILSPHSPKKRLRPLRKTRVSRIWNM